MATIQVDPKGTVSVRGIHFPVECIRAAMLETGGIVVSDPNINQELDRAMAARKGDVIPDMLYVEAIPAMYFVPKRVNIHNFVGAPGRKSNIFLYFAVKRQFHA